MSESILAEFLQQGVELLKEEDPALWEKIMTC